jgi:serine/threonine protein kinase
MSRSNYYTAAEDNRQYLPWKWMSPESLKSFKFSSKSDVWSYGVFLFEVIEIYSLSSYLLCTLWDSYSVEKNHMVTKATLKRKNLS